ncbi:MAG: hypothetical protein ACOH2T_19190 [Pseudomonas sp.]
MSQIYAGIGSRQTPPHILTMMENVAYLLGKDGATLRSGAADGADRAFEFGAMAAGGKLEIFIPWKGFNGSTSPLFIPSQDAFTIAAAVHPNWAACSQGAKRLHARNVHQVMGADLKTPVISIICWTPYGQGGGGTGQALRTAKLMAPEVEILDLGRNDAFQRVSDWLG